MIQGRKYVYTIFGSLFMLLISVQSVSAQSWLPPFLSDILSSRDVVAILANRVQVGFTVGFLGVVGLAVVFILVAAARYVRSRGDSGEIENSNKSMQAIFMGVAALFVGLMGLAALFIFFGSSFDPSIHASCINYPDGSGCYACKNPNNGTLTEGETSNQIICSKCDRDPRGLVEKTDLYAKDGFELEVEKKNGVISDSTDVFDGEFYCNGDVREVR